MPQLYVRSVGAASQALVLLHGWGFDSQVWTLLLPELSALFTVYVVDLPGFGESDEMTWAQFVAQLLSVLPETFAVAGWSLGGLYAMRLAIEYPLRVERLISIGSAPRILAEPGWPLVQVDAFDAFSAKILANPAQTLSNFLRIQAPQQTFTFTPKRPLTLSALEAGLHILKTWDLRKSLTQVKSACFMFGRLDMIVPVAVCEVMKQQYPHFHYVVFQRAGHAPFLSHPTAFIEELRRACS